ncbi:MAG TPA: TonB family protein, partial [Solirubrobacteraceae bacterium]
VIHRDIKPSNLILYEGERVKVTDFGIAKLVDAEMTQSGTLLGTPSYMSPEQAMGDKLDGRSDIFSLGVCAFEMLSGEQPFPGTNVTSILYKLVHVDPIEPANLEMNGLVPQKWHEVFSRVLAKKPDDRYQTASDFVQDLEYCLGSWFGAAMDDDTLSEVGGAAVRTAAAARRASSAPRRPAPAPPASAAAEDVTASLPGLEDSPADALSALVEPPAAEDDLPATIQMKPGQPPPFSGAKTVTPEKTVTPVEATVLMKGAPSPPPAPPRAKAPKAPKVEEDVPATVVLASTETVRAKAPEVTLRSPAPPTIKQPPAAKAKAAPPPAAPPPPTPPSTATAPLAVEDPAASPAPVVAPARAGRKSATTLVVVGAVAALLLLGIGLVALVLAKRPNEVVATPAPVTPSTTLAAVPTTVPTTAAPPAVLGAVHVESQPAGATVTVDNQPRGVAPLDVPDLALGHHDVKVELKGYSPAAQGVELVADTPRAELKLTLARVAPAMAVADILSTPLGATVKVDGAVVGHTPLVDFKLKPGPHSVEVSKDGYETWSQTANAGGKKLFVDAALRQVARATPPPPAPDVVDVTKIYAENEVDTPPKKLSGMTASYPSGRAPRLRAGDSVSVTLNYVVTETGQIGDLKVTESGGKAVDDEVLSALKEWKYAPGSKRGTSVKVRLVRKFTFKGG